MVMLLQHAISLENFTRYPLTLRAVCLFGMPGNNYNIVGHLEFSTSRQCHSRQARNPAFPSIVDHRVNAFVYFYSLFCLVDRQNIDACSSLVMKETIINSSPWNLSLHTCLQFATIFIWIDLDKFSSPYIFSSILLLLSVCLGCCVPVLFTRSKLLRLHSLAVCTCTLTWTWYSIGCSSCDHEDIIDYWYSIFAVHSHDTRRLVMSIWFVTCLFWWWESLQSGSITWLLSVEKALMNCSMMQLWCLLFRARFRKPAKCANGVRFDQFFCQPSLVNQ